MRLSCYNAGFHASLNKRFAINVLQSVAFYPLSDFFRVCGIKALFLHAFEVFGSGEGAAGEMLLGVFTYWEKDPASFSLNQQ